MTPKTLYRVRSGFAVSIPGRKILSGGKFVELTDAEHKANKHKLEEVSGEHLQEYQAQQSAIALQIGAADSAADARRKASLEEDARIFRTLAQQTAAAAKAA